MYKKFRDKEDGVIKVVLRPGDKPKAGAVCFYFFPTDLVVLDRYSFRRRSRLPCFSFLEYFGFRGSTSLSSIRRCP